MGGGRHLKTRVLVSHSVRDEAIISRLVDRLRLSIEQLTKNEILNTSQPSTGLRSGEWITPQLLSSIKDCDCFIAIVSDSYLSSEYCMWELGVAQGNGRPIVAGHLQSVKPEQLGGVLQNVNLHSLWRAESFEALLREVADRLPDEYTCRVERQAVDDFCTAVAAHPGSPIETWRKALVQEEDGQVFLNTYGLARGLERSEVFQDFYTIGKNMQPIQYLWADSRPGRMCRIAAELGAGSERADASLSVFFSTARNSFGCNIAIRPQNRKALLSAGRDSLLLQARIPRADERQGPEFGALREVGILVRIVNGYMQHWTRCCACKTLLCAEEGDYRMLTVPLRDGCWKLFGEDGTGPEGPKEPDFSIIASVNLALGGYDEFMQEPTPGSGSLEIRSILLSDR